MTNTEISLSDFEDIIQDFPYDSVYEKYSGRGMFGATCVGIVTDSRPDGLRRVLERRIERTEEVIEEDDDDLDWEYEEELLEVVRRMISCMSWDSMGKDTIVYFPGISVT